MKGIHRTALRRQRAGLDRDLEHQFGAEAVDALRGEESGQDGAHRHSGPHSVHSGGATFFSSAWSRT